MNEVKKQKIAVLVNLDQDDRSLILNGVHVASIFGKELCLVYNRSRNDKAHQEKYKQMLQDYLIPLRNELPQLKFSTLITKSDNAHLPLLLADDYEAILIVTQAEMIKKFSKALSRTPVPFLFVQPKGSIPSFKKLVMPVDLRNETSDSAIWTSYFGRFNQSEVTVIAARETNRDNEKQVNKNVLFTKKLFQKFNISHKIYKGQKSSWRIAWEALDYAQSSESDMYVILGSSSVTPLDWIIGLPERKIINQAAGIPVLYINPRRDNYILCD